MVNLVKSTLGRDGEWMVLVLAWNVSDSFINIHVLLHNMILKEWCILLPNIMIMGNIFTVSISWLSCFRLSKPVHHARPAGLHQPPLGLGHHGLLVVRGATVQGLLLPSLHQNTSRCRQPSFEFAGHVLTNPALSHIPPPSWWST